MTTRVLQLIKQYQRIELIRFYHESGAQDDDKPMLSRAFKHGCHVTEAKGEICPICKEVVGLGILAQHVAACFHRFEVSVRDMDALNDALKRGES